MINFYDGAVEIDGEILTSASQDSDLETQTSTTVEESEVPVGYEEDTCVYHWAMLVLTLLFGAYCLFRVFSRSKATGTRTNPDAS